MIRTVKILTSALTVFFLCIGFGFGICFGLVACSKAGGTMLTAERSAPLGGEFLRFYKDGSAIYGFAVVKENIKAAGNYRYSQDTLFFQSESFKPHFPNGYITVRGDTLYMENGLHFQITKNILK
jgi:hypothetical protein